VEFTNNLMAHTACMLDGLMLAERSLRVSMAKTPRVARTIHISGVDGQVTEQHLAQYFSVCGEVCAVQLSRAQRCAWVEFTTQESWQGSMSLDGQMRRLTADGLGTQQLRILASKSAIQSNGLGTSLSLSLSIVAKTYSDEKVANREIRVWHGATGNGP
jgi:hypothetical protein